MLKPDSLIFDRDGTLWDNVDTYVAAWNKGLEAKGYDLRLRREDLVGLMGKEIGKMLNRFLPEISPEEEKELFNAIVEAYQSLTKTMTPKIFPGVREGLEKLATKYKLFMLSNCEEGGIPNFMNYTGTRHLFTDYMEHGQNFQPKSFNLKLLIDRNRLQSPVYIGDTDSDSREAAKAGVPFVYVSYGFGETDNYALKFDSFPELTNYFMNL
ncbi:MAG: HAD family hydrolase [Dysgonamonadaceae bacterium]|jgi:phosphoglycolate phosphatase